MVPQFPTGYGFTAIIVAFLGRLHPLGIVILAGIVLAVTYVGGEVRRPRSGCPSAATGIFQAMMLFFLLASDILDPLPAAASRRPPREARDEHRDHHLDR